MTAATDNVQAIAEAAALLRTARFAAAFTGAGISTPSGIPDFRDPESGLWSHTDPLAVASIYGFRQNPQAFYDWVHPLARQIVTAQPNAAHRALADLEAVGILKSLMTQNIDMLHTRAGSKTVHEIHGSLRQATCTHCFAIYPGEAILGRFLQDGQTPRCAHCGGVIKPNVILFGEQLPYRPLQAAREAARRADVMLVIGSSLEVVPASHLPQIALRNHAKLVIINHTPTDFDRFAHIIIHADAAEALPAIASRCLKEAV
jgi:NAD-dependent deacetylase